MAIISTLVGGLCGFFTFLLALVFFEVSFLTALGLYVLVGLGLTATLIIAGMTRQAMTKSPPQRPALLPYSSRMPAGSPLSKQRG
ncbi:MULTISPECIES: hypothetical protein [unclassified Roseobacter]|uniref:hypothetical protein n=1 Tax=unclassified Roseobacter TaxID=196798 RepID=UPI0018A27761|nr:MULTISPECIES: hypothetical protein [unclassified Roseobacter]MDW3180995.1 hypothetical protein [Roseobacter sp.]